MYFKIPWLIILAGLLVTRAFAQHPAALTVHPLNGGVYWIEGGQSNTAFIVGRSGVVLFDAQGSPQDALSEIAAIGKITSKPIHEIVLSHSDPDHVGGLPAYPAGVEIISSENTKSTMLASAIAAANTAPNSIAQQVQNNLEPEYKALVSFLPTRTIAFPQYTVLDGIPVVLGYLAPAHTSGDLFLYLPQQKIVLAGDILTPGFTTYPIIHVGGSSQGWIENVEALLLLDVDTYVSGHGQLVTKSMLQAMLQNALQIRNGIKALVDRNASYAEVKAAFPETPAGFNGLLFPTYTQTTYDELVQGYPKALPPWNNFGLVQ